MSGLSGLSGILGFPEKPSPPTSLVATPTGITSIALTWTAGSADSTAQTLDYSTDGGSTWTNISSSLAGNANSYSFSSNPGTGYLFRVAATDAAGASSYVVTNSAVDSIVYGMVGWWDGSDATSLYTGSGHSSPVSANGDSIQTFADKSGNGNDFVQATSGTRPTYVTGAQNGLSGVNFNGSQAMQLASLTLGTHSIFIVFKATANGLLFEHSPNTNSYNGLFLATTVGSTFKLQRDASPLSDGQFGTDYVANWGITGSAITAGWMNGGTAATNLLYVNNSLVLTAAGATLTSCPSVTDAFNLCSRNQDSIFVTGVICELLIYTPMVSDVSAIWSYLRSKWATW
jgi:hypothetical protein